MRKLQQIAKAAAAAGVEIVCRLTFPSGPARGAALLLPGSLFSDVDGNYPAMNLKPHLYADLAAQLGERGFAVLRMAKIGPGTGSRTVDAQAAARHAADAIDGARHHQRSGGGGVHRPLGARTAVTPGRSGKPRRRPGRGTDRPAA